MIYPDKKKFCSIWKILLLRNIIVYWNYLWWITTCLLHCTNLFELRNLSHTVKCRLKNATNRKIILLFIVFYFSSLIFYVRKKFKTLLRLLKLISYWWYNFGCNILRQFSICFMIFLLLLSLLQIVLVCHPLLFWRWIKIITDY